MPGLCSQPPTTQPLSGSLQPLSQSRENHRDPIVSLVPRLGVSPEVLSALGPPVAHSLPMSASPGGAKWPNHGFLCGPLLWEATESQWPRETVRSGSGVAKG